MDTSCCISLVNYYNSVCEGFHGCYGSMIYICLSMCLYITSISTTGRQNQYGNDKEFSISISKEFLCKRQHFGAA